jgi:hypothetical protein
MKWATRANIHIDRAACAWLIRRHIDPDAEFVFLDDPARIPSDTTGFDMRGVALSHHNGDCSFETILRRYQLDDPVLWRLAAIIHEADLDDERYGAPEAPGLDTALRGLFDDLHRRTDLAPHRPLVRRPLRVPPPRHPPGPRTCLSAKGAPSAALESNWCPADSQARFIVTSCLRHSVGLAT